MEVVKRENFKKKQDGQVIKPEDIKPVVDTSGWPLLLKNWSDCEFEYLEMARV